MHARPRGGAFATAADALADIMSREDLAAFAATSPVIIHADDCGIGRDGDDDMENCTCSPTIVARPQSALSS
jgi:hypothetical protein